MFTLASVTRMATVSLRDAGYVRSEKGHGGGWVIAADLETVSLLDVHRAVGGPRIFAIGNAHPHTDCAVEKVVNAALEDALAEAEALLVARLGAVKLAELAQSFDARCAAASDTEKYIWRRRCNVFAAIFMYRTIYRYRFFRTSG
jgi:DNA-binding IscR family transcriptional regulator